MSQHPCQKFKNITTNSNWTKNNKTHDKTKPFTYILGTVNCHYNKNFISRLQGVVCP
jgi:hypothetical protein